MSLATLLLGYNSSANLTVGGLGRGAGARRDRGQRAVPRDDAARTSASRGSTSSSSTSTPRSPRSTRCASCAASWPLRGRAAGRAAGLPRRAGAGRRRAPAPVRQPQPELLAAPDRDRRRPRRRRAAPRRRATAGRAGQPRSAIADRLRFLYVGQRARAESVVQQRQPGLIEALVRQQIHNPVWQEDFGRMLFQLMVPHDFKDAARQLDRVVLVVDSYTANLPWELMLADDPSAHGDGQALPLALRTRGRAPARRRRASGARCARASSAPRWWSATRRSKASAPRSRTPTASPTRRPAAAARRRGRGRGRRRACSAAWATRSRRRSAPTRPPATCWPQLYRQPYRILHISAHGVFDLLHPTAAAQRRGAVRRPADHRRRDRGDGDRARAGVPELLPPGPGRTPPVRDGNKLAASVARELIEIGVRCVVVAGWAVNDEPAQLFGETFYEQLLQRRRAVRRRRLRGAPGGLEARTATTSPGAPSRPTATPAGWPSRAPTGAGGAETAGPYRLARRAARRAGQHARRPVAPQRPADRRARPTRQVARDRAGCCDKRCPPGWRTLPALQSALGATWRDLGQLRAGARGLPGGGAGGGHRRPGADPGHRAARQRRDQLGEQRAEQEILAGPPAANRASTKRRADGRALKRLDGLDAVVRSGELAWPGGRERPTTARRCRWRRTASAPRCAAAPSSTRPRTTRAACSPAGSTRPRRTRCATRWTTAWPRHRAYRSGEGSPGSDGFSPYHALNRLALDALTAWESPDNRGAAVELAQQCRRAAEQGFNATPEPLGRRDPARGAAGRARARRQVQPGRRCRPRGVRGGRARLRRRDAEHHRQALADRGDGVADGADVAPVRCAVGAALRRRGAGTHRDPPARPGAARAARPGAAARSADGAVPPAAPTPAAHKPAPRDRRVAAANKKDAPRDEEGRSKEGRRGGEEGAGRLPAAARLLPRPGRARAAAPSVAAQRPAVTSSRLPVV